MKKCILFCAGDCSTLLQPPDTADLVIAADGGLVHTRHLGITPHIILGDFDSLGYIPDSAEVHPVEKDDTDSMLAIKKGLRLGCSRFDIYGGLDGDRVDHTVANFQALVYLTHHGARGYLIGLRQIATVITNGTLTLPAHFSGHFSVFCMGADARGVTIRGCQYELDDAALSAGFPLGISNRFLQREVTVSVREGSLLLIWDRENAIP